MTRIIIDEATIKALNNTLNKLTSETVEYKLDGIRLAQFYKSEYFPDATTVIAIPVQVSNSLVELGYYLKSLDKTKLYQTILSDVFTSYFDMNTAVIVPANLEETLAE